MFKLIIEDDHGTVQINNQYTRTWIPDMQNSNIFSDQNTLIALIHQNLEVV